MFLSNNCCGFFFSFEIFQRRSPWACDFDFIIEFLYTVSAKCSFVEVSVAELGRQCRPWRKCNMMGFVLTHNYSNTKHK